MSLFPQLRSQPGVVTTPGDLLLRLNETCNASVFSSLVLQQYLCPALDALPADQRANLMTILREAERSAVDVSSHFGRLDLSGEGSDGEDGVFSDNSDNDFVDSNNVAGTQLTESRRRIEALIAADATEKVSSYKFDEEALSSLPLLWHLGAEMASNTGEVFTVLELCDTISPRCSNLLNCTIVNIKKSPVYSNSGSLSEHVGWIRRELFLKNASSGGMTRVLPVLFGLQSGDLQRIIRWLPESTAVDAATTKELQLAHWPEVVRKMAVQLKGLVEGVLKKKTATSIPI